METVKVSAFSVQTAAKHKTVYWVQNQYDNGRLTAQITCHMAKRVKPNPINLAL